MTGITGGIGSALAWQIVKTEKKVKVCGLVRDKKRLDAGLLGCGIDFIESDLRNFTDAEGGMVRDWIERQSGGGTCEMVLILCAGTVYPVERAGCFAAGEIRDNVAVNIMSQAELVNISVAAAERAGMSVRIIQYDSGAAYRPIKGWSLYCAAKSYMAMYLRVLKEEHPEYKIVLLDPGVADTGMQETIRASSKEAFPDVDIFIGYKKEGMLRTPECIARLTCEDYINSWTAAGICEKLR